MASRPKQIAAKPTTSRDLVTVGKRDITVSKHGSKRDKDGRRPTTSKALILRNGKHGSMGTGEIVLAGKMSGREKMDLLAEDYTDKFQKAIAPHFDLEKCLNIADAQYNAYLDEILFLRDPDIFINKIMAEVGARTPPKNGKKQPPALNKPTFVAETVATRIHNAYMIASAWRLILHSLGELRINGLGDRNAATQLRHDSDLRGRYLVLYDMVGKLVEIGQSKFNVLATTTPQYAQYFKPDINAAPDEPDTVFDHDALKYACKSFLDSIVIELAFPDGAYSKRVLFQLLHDAVDECPRESKRFPQELWDAVGDLSVTIELQELLEGPLLAANAAALKNEPHEMPDEYEKWVDAQIISEEASKHIDTFQGLVNPLTKTRTKSGLDSVWKSINQNYKSVSGGQDIDTVWQLDGALERSPQWHSVYVPALADDGPPGLALAKGKRANKSNKKMLAISNGADDESNDSMPPLTSVSDTPEESSNDESSDDENDENDDDDDDDSDAGYNTDEEDELREMMKEAMNAAMENPDFFDPRADPKDFQAFNEIANERKGNPFLKLLGSLRGRVFNSNPKLRSTTKSAPPKGFKVNTPAPPKPGSIPKIPATTTPTQGIPSQPTPDPKGQKVTMEEVEDEDAPTQVVGKKKKKKPKKKKKKATIDGDSIIPESPPISPAKSPEPTPIRVAPSSPTPLPKKVPATKPPPLSSTAKTTSVAQTSTISLGQTAVQSGHSYVKDLDAPKTKVKSRGDHASNKNFGNSKESTEKKSGFFSKFRRKDQGPSDEPPPEKSSKNKWFAHLNKKSNKLMHQLLNTTEDEKQGQASMKWDHFVQVMEGMGFKYEPSKAGSRVRFDPPNRNDPSVTFHKPHPVNVIHPIKLKEYSKTLRNMYGWTRDDFMKASAPGK